MLGDQGTVRVKVKAYACLTHVLNQPQSLKKTGVLKIKPPLSQRLYDWEPRFQFGTSWSVSASVSVWFGFTQAQT